MGEWSAGDVDIDSQVSTKSTEAQLRLASKLLAGQMGIEICSGGGCSPWACSAACSAHPTPACPQRSSHSD